MKILHVIHGFPPYNIAGSEIYTHKLAREMVKLDEVYIFHRIADRNLKEYELMSRSFDGLRVYSINHTLKYRNSFEATYKNETIAYIFGKLLDEIHPDVVHFGHLLYLSMTLISEVKKRNIPVVFTLHDYWLICAVGQLLKPDLMLCAGPESSECIRCLTPKLAMNRSIRRSFEALKSKFPSVEDETLFKRVLDSLYKRYAKIFLLLRNSHTKNQIERRLAHINKQLQLVDIFIAPSRFLLQKFVDFGIPNHKIVYHDYGFNIDLFRNFIKAPCQKIRFGYMGTFIPSKGVHVLIRAFNNLNCANTELRIHGKFPNHYKEFLDYWHSLRSLSENDNIVWLGEYNHQDVPRILSEVDILVVPSIWYENSPLVIHEAFMAHIPVITSNLGGMAELVQDGVNGLLFDVGDEKDLARKMQMVINNPDLIKRLSNNIGPVIPITNHALEIRDIYRSLII